MRLPIKPMLAQASAVPADGVWPHPFLRDDYSFEVKYDGNRTVATRDRDKVELWTREGHRVGYKYPDLCDAIRATAPPSCVLDGEIVVYEATGGMNERTDFQRLQQLARLDREDRAESLVYMAFDLLEVDGQDIQREPLFERRKRLVDLEVAGQFDVATSMPDGQKAWATALEVGYEGLIAKPLRSRYVQDNRGIWSKHKRNVRQQFEVIGLTSGEGSRAGVFGALILGEEIDGRIRYAGKCGTGFNGAAIATVLKAVAPGYSTEPTVDRVQAIRVAQHLGARKVSWIRPGTAKVLVEFNDWTADRIVRMGSFKGIDR